MRWYPPWRAGVKQGDRLVVCEFYLLSKPYQLSISLNLVSMSDHLSRRDLALDNFGNLPLSLVQIALLASKSMKSQAKMQNLFLLLCSC
jgi:hypothetical protein